MIARRHLTLPPRAAAGAEGGVRGIAGADDATQMGGVYRAVPSGRGVPNHRAAHTADGGCGGATTWDSKPQGVVAGATRKTNAHGTWWREGRRA